MLFTWILTRTTRAMGVTLGLLIGLPSSASAQFTAPDPFPGYERECGYPIVLRTTLALSEAIIDFRGRLKIVLDPVLTANGEQDRMQFLLAHECAHHQMNHALPVSRRARAQSHGVVRDQELSADCWAAELLARLGHERPILIMTQRFHRAGLYSPGGGYPAGIQRASIIQQCAENGRRALLDVGQDQGSLDRN
ncbi:MAG: hypothetical protein AAFN27_17565 [Pseudomonadota bacterium]